MALIQKIIGQAVVQLSSSVASHTSAVASRMSICEVPNNYGVVVIARSLARNNYTQTFTGDEATYSGYSVLGCFDRRKIYSYLINCWRPCNDEDSESSVMVNSEQNVEVCDATEDHPC